MPAKIAVLGEGSWGTAIACVLADNGYEVTIWCHEELLVSCINDTHSNSRYMKNIVLPKAIKATACMKTAIDNTRYIFVAIPVQYLRSIYKQLSPLSKKENVIISLSKGIEQNTLYTPSYIIKELLPSYTNMVTVSGPSFARELIKKKTTGLIVASQDPIMSNAVGKLLKNSYCLIQYSYDVHGIELCAAFKNVIAIGVGILEGACYGDNTKALFMTLCIQELWSMLKKHTDNPSEESLLSFAGIGDILLTAYGSLGRNREVGIKISLGMTLDEIIASTGYTPEGINTLKSLNQLAHKYGLKLPVITSIYNVIYHKTPISHIITTIQSVV